MTPLALLTDLRARGIELRLSDDGADVLCRGGSGEDRDAIAREKLWLLMLLAHEAGGDLYDPRLAFLAEADQGLTCGAIATRMEFAFGVERELADVLIELAEDVGYLVRRGDLYQSSGLTAFSLKEKT